MSRDTRYTYQYRIRCDVTRLNLPGHVIAMGTPAIRHIHVKICKNNRTVPLDSPRSAPNATFLHSLFRSTDWIIIGTIHSPSHLHLVLRLKIRGTYTAVVPKHLQSITRTTLSFALCPSDLGYSRVWCWWKYLVLRRDEKSGKWRRSDNKELHDLHWSTNVNWGIKQVGWHG